MSTWLVVACLSFTSCWIRPARNIGFYAISICAAIDASFTLEAQAKARSAYFGGADV